MQEELIRARQIKPASITIRILVPDDDDGTTMDVVDVMGFDSTWRLPAT